MHRQEDRTGVGGHCAGVRLAGKHRRGRPEASHADPVSCSEGSRFCPQNSGVSRELQLERDMAGVTMPPSREEPELSELLQSRGASGSVGAQRAALWGEDEDDFNTINNLIGPPEAAGPRTHILLHCAQRQGPARPAGCAGGTRERRRGEGTVWKTEVHSFTAEVSFSGQLTVQSSNFQLGCCKNFKTCNTWTWSQGHWPCFPQTVE